MTVHDEVLTVEEVARDLRCSRAHVHNAINGRVVGLTPLRVLSLGRRRLVRRSTLEKWKLENERTASTVGMIRSSPNIDAADA